MIPLRDTIPSERPPVVTWALIAACAVVYLWQCALDLEPTGYKRTVRMGWKTRQVKETQNDRFVERWGAIPFVVIRGYVPVKGIDRRLLLPVEYEIREPVPLKRRFAPLLASLFLHGSLLHLLSNMWFLFIFGDNVEGRLGHGVFLLFYLAGGIVASLAHVVANPSSAAPIVGASGAISAVLGAYLLLFPGAFVVTLVPIFIFPLMIHVPAVLFLGLWFFTQITNGFGALVDTTGGIAWFAHIGGFLFGVAMVFVNYPKWRRPRLRYTRAEPVAS